MQGYIIVLVFHFFFFRRQVHPSSSSHRVNMQVHYILLSFLCFHLFIFSIFHQDLSATRTNRYARFSRREGRCRRLPAAFRRLAGDFRVLRGLAPGAGATTTEPLRAASCLCLFLAIAADALLSQGKKSVLVGGSRDKSELS